MCSLYLRNSLTNINYFLCSVSVESYFFSACVTIATDYLQTSWTSSFFGLACNVAACESRIAVSQVAGVPSIKVGLLAERAEVILDTSVRGASQHVVINTIRDLGFTCIPLRTESLQTKATAGNDEDPTNQQQQDDIIRLRIGRFLTHLGVLYLSCLVDT